MTLPRPFLWDGLLLRTGIPGDGRCLFRSVVHGACLRSGKLAPSEVLQKELADELRENVRSKIHFYCFFFFVKYIIALQIIQSSKFLISFASLLMLPFHFVTPIWRIVVEWFEQVANELMKRRLDTER